MGRYILLQATSSCDVYLIDHCMGWSYSLCTMGFTIEVTEVGVLAAIVCVLFLMVTWLLWSRRKQDEETKMLKKLLVQEKDSQRGNDDTNHKGSARLGHAMKEIFESPSYLSNVDNSDSSQNDNERIDLKNQKV